MSSKSSKIAVVFLILLLQGCVAYPAKNVKKPAIEVMLDDPQIDTVYVKQRAEINTSACEDGTKLESNERGTFSSTAEYSWIKFVLLMPADCGTSINICVLTKTGRQMSWQDNLLIDCNTLPEIYSLTCTSEMDTLVCKQM